MDPINSPYSSMNNFGANLDFLQQPANGSYLNLNTGGGSGAGDFGTGITASGYTPPAINTPGGFAEGMKGFGAAATGISALVGAWLSKKSLNETKRQNRFNEGITLDNQKDQRKLANERLQTRQTSRVNRPGLQSTGVASVGSTMAEFGL